MGSYNENNHNEYRSTVDFGDGFIAGARSFVKKTTLRTLIREPDMADKEVIGYISQIKGIFEILYEPGRLSEHQKKIYIKRSKKVFGEISELVQEREDESLPTKLREKLDTAHQKNNELRETVKRIARIDIGAT
ncbi:hypothetical protein KY358_05410 [Candidatus Woesearchaeota archaeon]|nr:hypothetical protein [Candidatus Woesearchaeota archaeon]